MIGYRFLTPAEIEMTEASAFYEAATAGFGSDFLDEIQRVIHLLLQHPELGRSIDHGFRQALLYPLPIQPNIFIRSGRNSDHRGRSPAPTTGLLERQKIKLPEVQRLTASPPAPTPATKPS